MAWIAWEAILIFPFPARRESLRAALKNPTQADAQFRINPSSFRGFA
jgi:hypothetical protein